VTVYVDPCLPYPHLDRRTGHLMWCHLLADTRDELHEFAGRLGLSRRAFQDHDIRWHYDIPEPVRSQAVDLGARSVDRRTIGLMLRGRRFGMPPG
jgi:hypothetical protein